MDLTQFQWRSSIFMMLPAIVEISVGNSQIGMCTDQGRLNEFEL